MRVRRVLRQEAAACRRSVLRAVPSCQSAAGNGAQPSQARLHGVRLTVHVAAARALQSLQEGDAVDQTAAERRLRRRCAQRPAAEHSHRSDDYAHEDVLAR